VRHVLSVADLAVDDLARLVDDGLAIAAGRWDSVRPLRDKVVGIYFAKTSTRTRTSFSVGAMKLGASIIAYGPNDLQTMTGETLADTARVLANYLDVLVVRTNGALSEMQEMAAQGRMAVINAMSSNEHPTQAIADLVTLKEALGRLDGVHLLYVGEGNNTASALALAVGRTPGMRLTMVTPENYGLPEEEVARAQAVAVTNGSSVEQHHRRDGLPRGVDAVYTARWLTMGVTKRDADWLDKFRPYTIDAALMAEVSRPGTVFLHDLPAMRGYEVTDEVLDGPQSIAFRQAFHKMTSAMAVLTWCAGVERPVG
jgi:ornithine carbamoyltransferase